MIGKKFTNNLKHNRSIFNDPMEWAMARNLAYASIRDDVEKIIKHTNTNSANVFINAENLMQNLKGHKINQYIEAERVTQEIDLTNEEQITQIFMNSNVFQTINYVTKESIIKKVRNEVKKDNASLFLSKYIVVLYIDGQTTTYGFNAINDIHPTIKIPIINHMDRLTQYQNCKPTIIKLINDTKKDNSRFSWNAIDTIAYFNTNIEYVLYDLNLVNTFIFIFNKDYYGIRQKHGIHTIITMKDNQISELFEKKKLFEENFYINYDKKNVFNASIEPMTEEVKKALGGLYGDKLFK